MKDVRSYVTRIYELCGMGEIECENCPLNDCARCCVREEAERYLREDEEE